MAEQYEIAIVGCGPTGAVLANLLGALGREVLVVERSAQVQPIPRALHVDEEALRGLQATGLLHAILPHTAPFQAIEVVDDAGRTLLDAEPGLPSADHGFDGARAFDQPAVERVLRDGLERYPRVEVRTGVRAVGVSEDGAGATLELVDGDGGATTASAGWVVACDGAHSALRDALGVPLTALAPTRRWLVIDFALRDGADASRLPDRVRYVLNRHRLTVYSPGFGAHRRLELFLGPDGAVPGDAEIRAAIAQWIDPDQVELLRSVPYPYRAQITDAWRVGHVLFAGDAAHLMPPSAGQGMCAGVRDAVNLAWKLDRVVVGAPTSLLDSYTSERRGHVAEVLRQTEHIDGRLHSAAALWSWLRNHDVPTLGAATALRTWLRDRAVRPPPTPSGCFDLGSEAAGVALPQVDVSHDHRWVRLDDRLGYRFALIAAAHVASEQTLAWATAHDMGVWRPGVELVEAGGDLAAFLRAHHLEFAIVRPDRRLFGGGLASALPRVRDAFDAAVGRAG